MRAFERDFAPHRFKNIDAGECFAEDFARNILQIRLQIGFGAGS